MNYSVARPVYSLALEFAWSAPEDLKAEVIELEEVIVDLSEFDSESLSEMLMEEEDLIWSHEGIQITLVNVEVG